MEVIGSAHGVDDDVREGSRAEALPLNVIAERGEVAINCAKLAAGLVVVGVL